MRLSLVAIAAAMCTLVAGQDPNPYYVALLNDSMWFYEAQRSGKLPPDNRVPWRSDSAMSDGSDRSVDLTGGYYDAGDYLKFTLPLSHSLTLIAWGAIQWFDGYSKANQTGYLANTIKWGTDWLIKAHPQPNVLFVQVGDGNIDNNYWGPDTAIPLPRPSYMVDVDSPGTDVASVTVAALASASYLFRNYLNDSDYADTLLSHAESLFSFAESSQPWETYTTAVSASKDYYATNTYTNQLVYGALWLYRATGNITYQQKASAYFDQFNLAQYPVTVMDWSDQSGAVYVLGAQVDGAAKYYQAAVNHLDTIINSTGPCSYTKGGLLWCPGSSESNSLVPPQDTSLLALLYNAIDSSKPYYVTFAMNQLNYLLGSNYMLTPYVCGIHKNSPQNPHHAGASGGTDIGDIDNSPPVEAHVLYGAVVGGPDKHDKFYDERSDYDQTEVALDYNAPFQGLVAYQLSQPSVPDPPYVFITQPRPKVSRYNGLAKWLIAVIVIVVVFVVAGLAYVAWWQRHRLFSRYCRGKALIA